MVAKCRPTQARCGAAAAAAAAAELLLLLVCIASLLIKN